MLFFPAVRISKHDWARLMQLAFDRKHNSNPAVTLLRSEVHRAIVVDEPKGTAEFVQLNRWVRFRLDKRDAEERALVHPDDYEGSELHLSVLTSLGAALIGVRVGDTMPFVCADGNLHLVTPLAIGRKLPKSALPKRPQWSAGRAVCCPPGSDPSSRG